MLAESFLYSVINGNDTETLFKVKDKFLPVKEQKYLEFVKDFYASYNKLPDLTTVENKFRIQLIDNTETTGYWYNEIISKYQEYVIEQAVVNSAKNKKKALDFFQQAIVDYNVDIDSKIADYSDTIRRATDYNNRKGTKGITYLSTGDNDLDAFSLGYKRADLWTIGGAEGMGKTWYLLRMALWLDQYMISKNIKKNILIVSGEMESSELEERMDAIICELSYARLSKGELTPAEERKYKRWLNGNYESNIRIVDSFDSLKDIDYFMTVYRPGATFIDGSHLLASSYDWTEIARVTAGMKKLTRNKKVPIVNTTHLKAEKGKSAKGGSTDDFAYTKGYTRDSDIVGVMYASDMMQLENKIGMDWVKVRRANRTQIVYENDYETCQTKVISNLTGQQLSGSISSSSGGSKRASRNGQLADDDIY